MEKLPNKSRIIKRKILPIGSTWKTYIENYSAKKECVKPNKKEQSN